MKAQKQLAVAQQRRVVRRVDPVSVARMTLALCTALSAVLLVGLLALFLMAKASGALAPVESFITSIGLSESGPFKIRFLGILLPVILVELAASMVATLLAVGAAMLYNAVSDVVGGVEVITRER